MNRVTASGLLYSSKTGIEDPVGGVSVLRRWEGRGIKVYISSAYSAPDDAGRLANTQRAMAAGVALLKAGHFPLVPHLSHWLDLYAEELDGERLPWQVWMGLDLAYLPACDALLRLPGPSKGADIEVAEAERLGIPIHYDIDDFLV